MDLCRHIIHQNILIKLQPVSISLRRSKYKQKQQSLKNLKMKRRTDPKRKIAKTLEADIEMIERVAEELISDSDDEDENEEQEEEETTESQGIEESTDKQGAKMSTVMSSKKAYPKSVSWSESEDNTPRYVREGSVTKTQVGIGGARPKSAKPIKPLIRQKQSLEEDNAVISASRKESGEGAVCSIVQQETSSATITKTTTSVVKKTSRLMERIRLHSSQSRQLKSEEVSEEEDDGSVDSDSDAMLEMVFTRQV